MRHWGQLPSGAAAGNLFLHSGQTRESDIRRFSLDGDRQLAPKPAPWRFVVTLPGSRPVLDGHQGVEGVILYNQAGSSAIVNKRVTFRFPSGSRGSALSPGNAVTPGID